jgi:hypothetical protein
MLIRFPDAEGLRLDLMLPDPKTASDLADDARGELHACVNRLRFVSSLLEELPDGAMDMSSRLELLLYHVDAYYAAAYRIRDLLQHFPPLQLSETARGKRTALWNLLLPICRERGKRVHEWSPRVVAMIGDDRTTRTTPQTSSWRSRSWTRVRLMRCGAGWRGSSPASSGACRRS